MELADPDVDQRAEWQENYIRECMTKKGFKQSSTMRGWRAPDPRIA
jgi:hypothetical protein